jgi:acetoacetyl-CoA synthetase
VDSKPKVELFSLVGYVCTRHGYWDLRRGREGQLKNRPRGRVRLYKAPYPSIPVRFWGDDARGGKFLKAYHDMYPDVWCHGDFIVMNPRTKGYIIHGRRSASASSLLACAHVLTLIFQRRSVEPLGRALWFGKDLRRSGTPRVFSRIDYTICAGQRRPQDKDEHVLLFIKMRAGHELNPAFEEAIRAAIKLSPSRRHIPSYIFEVEGMSLAVSACD